MKGTTHLAIGVAIGAAACLYYPFSFDHAAAYVTVAGFSALSADLDGPSNLLSGKLRIGKLSKLLREFALWGGIIPMSVLCYLYVAQDRLYPVFSTCAVALFLLGLVAKEGVIRNTLVSLIGCSLIFSGWKSNQQWLMGLGAFVAIAPWLAHRGMTHTVWALPIWHLIGSGLESRLDVEGIALVATVGYASHLLADTLTPSGVKWLYPIYKRSIKLRV
ncbi:metal-dependent hydrolase [Cohnella endophytica]|uniref:Metal-dependent hydrolase n=1 Tax=Cohnella endophytica TaxID=2419778 RepID=A0A494Y7I9_9BACL|nr:metal-dependent hydrolase [Cohnella endophytica]RKP58043.1 metal-dependent hydrolase [Cohnella endophytica]